MGKSFEEQNSDNKEGGLEAQEKRVTVREDEEKGAQGIMDVLPQGSVDPICKDPLRFFSI